MMITSLARHAADWRRGRCAVSAAVCLLALLGPSPIAAAAAQDQSPAAVEGGAAPAAASSWPDAYVIGPGDVLSVRFWRQDRVSSDVVVRPDGMVSLLLLDDVRAAGLTPEQLRDNIQEQATKFFEDPQVTVIVKQVNSRVVYITGMVGKPGPYPLLHPMTVLQLIATAGGLQDYANGDDIVVIRTENGQQTTFSFNYGRVRKRSGEFLDENITLKPGDTVVVP
jgi:polysaccharide biosynthesis/export protein